MLDDDDAPIVAGVLTAADRSAVARLSAIELEDTDACASAVEFEDSDVAPTDVGGVELPTTKRAKVVKPKKCEDCKERAPSYGLSVRGGGRRWCSTCAEAHPGAVSGAAKTESNKAVKTEKNKADDNYIPKKPATPPPAALPSAAPEPSLPSVQPPASQPPPQAVPFQPRSPSPPAAAARTAQRDAMRR